MKFFKSLGILSLFALLLFTACRKDEVIEGNDPPITNEPDVIVNGSISGIVTDEVNQALSNALVTIGPNTSMSDENGFFFFNNVEINEKGSLVTAEKDGYFYNAKFVGSKLNKLNFTRIMMIEKVLSGSFTAASGGTVTTNGGASIDFPVNGIKQASGNNYSGNVNVYATWLDPTSTDLAQRMPGDLRASDSSEEQVQLTTYGMVGVELEGDSGEPLNLADGQTATIEFPVPASLVANAPATIPLWHFDESSGYWIQEGEATLQDNKYVGTVSHFSFWNCDVPNDYIYLDGTITDSNGDGIQSLTVIVTEVSSGMVGYAWTNEDGAFAGFVPNDQNLTISVLDNCGSEIYTAAIGPYSMDATLPAIEVTTSNNFITISGSLVCDMDPVTNGYLLVNYSSYGSSALQVDANGNFSGTISICDASTVDVTGFDIDNLKQSLTSTHDVSTTTNLILGEITVCEDLAEYVTYSIDGDSFTSLDATAQTTSASTLTIVAFDPDSLNTQAYFFMDVEATTTGTYNPAVMEMGFLDPAGFFQNAACNDCLGVDVTITTFEAVGGFVIGSFTGTIDNPQSGTQDVEGLFKVMLE